MVSLQAFESTIPRYQGAYYEGDVFSVLAHSCFILRSFEFATADGANDCNGRFDGRQGYADRFWATYQALREMPGSKKLLLFDVKAKMSQYAGDQVYLTTLHQRNEVAFYIGICAANPSFVELVPNVYQGLTGPSVSAELDREVAVNVSRISKLAPSKYKLDPCGSPYRMPLHLLAEAVRRVRGCVNGGGHYINPWTHVPFPTWRTRTAAGMQPMTPVEQSGDFTSFLAVMEIYRATLIASHLVPMQMDLIGLQPRLAHFKFVLNKSVGLHHSAFQR